MSYEQARRYLAKVIPWPQDGEPPAYVNIHTTFKAEDRDKPLWGGRAVRSLDEAINALDYALRQPNTRDIYLCMSTQRAATQKTGKNGFKYYTPVRNQEGVVALKSLFLDIDFKGGEHGYDTREEAIRELARFLKETGLPKPNLLVLSGGGVHVYWTMARSLTLGEWRPLAYALAEATKRHHLKCDTQCTVDGARVLRVPDTFNRKLEVPRPVSLAGQGLDFDYSVERLEAALEPYKVALPKPQAIILPAAFQAPSPSVIAKFSLNNDLAAGIEKQEYAPVKLDDVAVECGFIREALATGGAKYTNEQWNLTNLISVFTEGGRADAHRMGDKHPTYSKESTDEQYERKEREKAEKGLGWPSCSTISASGCTACAGCKHFSAGRTPLYALAQSRPATPPAALVPAAVTPGVTLNDLPNGYTRGRDGIVHRLLVDEDGVSTPVPICEYSMEDPFLSDRGVLHFYTKRRGTRLQVSIPLAIVSTQEMRKHFQDQQFMLPVGQKATEAVSRFLMSWIKQLHETRDSVKTVSFGWSYSGADLDGFVYGGSLWTPTGDKPAAVGDSELTKIYAVAGDEEPWFDAAKLITDQKRPGLEAILASSFAAPLVAFTGEDGTLLSVCGPSGIGKSTAVKTAQGVWGGKVGIGGLTDTEKNASYKMGQLQSLPFYWDEIKSEEQTRKFVNLSFKMTQGRDDARMTRDIKMRSVGEWRTLLVAASNDSLLDYIVKHTSTTTAGLYRIFEIDLKPPTSNLGQVVPSNASLITDKLRQHHGMIGLRYAKFLGAHHMQIAADMKLLLEQLNTETNAKNEERFWMVIIGSIILGARYANHLGLTQIDEPALKAYLLDALAKMRNELSSQPVDMGREINVANVMASFFAAMKQRHTLFTNKIHLGRGKPSYGSIKVDGNRCNVSQLGGIYVQFGVENKILRVVNSALCEWLDDRGISRSAITRALKEQFNAKHTTARMGSGTSLVNNDEYIWEIDCNLHPSLSLVE